MEKLSGLIEGIGGFQQKQQKKAEGLNLSSLYEEFGLDTDIPVTDMSGPEKQSRLAEFWSDTMQAKDQGFEDMGFGASLVLNDNETNMLSLEQKYQRSLNTPVEELGWDPDSNTRFLDGDWFANVIGGTLPSISTMIAGGVAGGVATAPAVVATPLGILGGATVGSGGGVGLQTLGATTKEAYIAYRQQGKSVEEAYELAYSDAKIDAAKSGALASVATFDSTSALCKRCRRSECRWRRRDRRPCNNRKRFCGTVCTTVSGDTAHSRSGRHCII